MSEENTHKPQKENKKVKSTTMADKLILNSPAISEMLRLYNSPAFKALAETQKSLYTLQNSLAMSEAMKSISILNSPALSEAIKSISILNSPALSEAIKSMSNFNSPALSEAIKSMSNFNSPAISEAIKSISNFNSSAMSEAIKSLSNLNSPTFKLESWSPFISNQLIFDNWVKTNTQLFDSVNKRILFARKLDTNILPVLSNNNWFITVSLENTFIQKLSQVIDSSSDKTALVLRHEFINYFSRDNFKNLKRMVKGWKDNSLFKPRLKIFLDCVSVLISSNNNCNPSNLLIPTLIAQIDGILTDYLIQNQFRITKQNGKIVWEDRNSNIIYGRKKVYKNIFEPTFQDYYLKNNYMSIVALGIGSDFILNTLFQTAYPLQNLKKPFGLSRHKIMHGENIKYGRKEHLFRTFLILDYLYGLENVDYN